MVEDNLDNLEVLKIMLEIQGATVVPVMSVSEAMNQLVEEDIIDLLINDISLPGEDGFDLIRWVRTDLSVSDLPDIAVTGYAAASDRTQILEAGFQRHLTKPIAMSELIATVIEVVTQ